MLSSFLTYIKKEKLFKPTDKVLLTVSGGIDSVVMCDLFHQAKIKFAIAHCNFQLRGKESNDDEKFVKALAKKYTVECFHLAFNTSTYAKKHQLSTQVAARELRYDWFEKIRKEHGYKYIATAHHKDDVIETFFINLMRGTGIKGLHGILPKNKKIIRPLLFCNKEEIKAYTQKNKLRYREDSSNASDKYVRNKLRHHVIPLLKTINPQLEDTMMNNIQHLREVETIYFEAIKQQRNAIVKEVDATMQISIPLLQTTNTPTTLLFEFLKPYGYSEAVVHEIIAALNGVSGKQFTSATHRLIKDRDFLIITKKSSIPEQQTLRVNKTQKEIVLDNCKLYLSKISKNATFEVRRSANIAQVDFDTLSFPLKIRKWKEGDTFQPIGMKGKKKVSDFFVDTKLSIVQKEKTWILCTSKDEIVWIVGYRIDDRFKIREKTQKVYVAEVC